MANEIVPSDFDFSNAESEGGLWSLNYFWELAGKPEEKRPSDWLCLNETKQLVKQVGKELNAGRDGILKAKRGKGGGTSGHWKLALEYAGHLSVELRSRYLDWIGDRIQEELNPDLAVTRGRDRGIEQWKQQGRSDEWIKQRLDSLSSCVDFTDSLKAHGCTEGYQFAACTNNVYKPLLGGTAKEVKASKGLAKTAKLRDNLTRVELMAIGLAEAIASERLEKDSVATFGECSKISSESGQKVAKVFEP